MSGFRAPLFAIGLSVSAVVAPSPGFHSPLFLLGLSAIPGTPPSPVLARRGGHNNDDEEILAVIMAFMKLKTPE